MRMRLLFAVLLLLTMLAACGTAAPTTPGSETPTTMLTTTLVAASDVTLPATPPTIVGEITHINGGVLVEQQPGASIGDKIVFSFNDATRIVARVGGELEQKTINDLAVGQRVEVWDAGYVAESFPAQADAETIIIADATAEMTTTPNAAAPPDREPDVIGTITQASNTVWIDNKLVLLIAPTTQFFRRSGKSVEVIDARDIMAQQRVEVWTTEIRYGGTPQADALTIVVIDD